VYDHLTDSEMTVNDIMIREHLAVAYYGQSKKDIEDEHLRNRELILAEGKYEV
jgi:hypothetical protein